MAEDAAHDAYYSDAAATFGDRLAAARDAAGLSPAQLAKRVRVRPASLAAWEDDRAEPRAHALKALADTLGVSMKWLMTGVGEGVPAPAELAREPAAEAGIEPILEELREVRGAQARLTERLGVLEKRLRAWARRG